MFLTGTGLVAGLASCLLATSYVYFHLVPIGNQWRKGQPLRLRFIDISEEHLVFAALLEAHKISERKDILPPDHELSVHLNTLGARLVQHVPIRLMPGQQFVFHVLDDSKPNAHVLPSGHIFVNRGLFKVGSEDDLLVVLAHEIAHLEANHFAERISLSRFPTVLKTAYSIISLLSGSSLGQVNSGRAVTDFVSQLMFTLPFSRTHEEEADQISLKYLISAQVRPDKAVEFWKKFLALQKHDCSQDESKTKIPDQITDQISIFSTHPSTKQRIDALEACMPEAMRLYHLRWTKKI